MKFFNDRGATAPNHFLNFPGTVACAFFLYLTTIISGCGSENTFRALVRLHVEHVVIIVQENRSFDNLFHGFPRADTASYGLVHDGRRVALRPISLTAAYDISNGASDFNRSFDSGKMDGWDHRRIALPRGVYPGVDPEYAYVPRREVAPYFALAQQYALADRMFQSNIDQSFAAHLYLIAGQAAHATNVPTGRPWGCDAPVHTVVATLTERGQPGRPVFPCFDLPTIGDELDARGLTWRFYAPKVDTAAAWSKYMHQRGAHKKPLYVPEFGQLWAAYDAIAQDRYGPDWTDNVVSPESAILTDIDHERLASVTWVVPDFKNSDHSSSKSTSGPSWVTTIVNRIGKSKFWPTTIIFVTWDDSGGWYDHVLPPRLDYDGLGFRVPLIVIGAYVRRGVVTHRQHEFGGILRFVETAFDLSPLAASDRRASSFSEVFDFDQKPRQYQVINATYPANYFLHMAASGIPPDDD